MQLFDRGGRTYAEVARLLGEYPNFVKRAVKRFKKTGDVKNVKGAGRPRKFEGKDLARVAYRISPPLLGSRVELAGKTPNSLLATK